MLDFLETHQGALLLAVLVGSFVVLSLCEVLFPRRRPEGYMGWRWLNNVSLTVTSLVLVRQVKLILPVTAAWWVSSTEFGLFQVVDGGWIFTLVVTFLVLDLSTYFYHRMSHAVPWLWRLHAVHHSDTEYDLTTTYRNHPINVIVGLGARLPAIIVLGAPVYAIVAYELFSTAIELFTHSNVRVPEKLDKKLRYIIVTPDYHRTHHSSTRRFTDSNFAGSFPLFDHLFGTVRSRPYLEHEKFEVGLEYFRSSRDSRLDQLLVMPFREFGKPIEPQTGLSRPAVDGQG